MGKIRKMYTIAPGLGSSGTEDSVGRGGRPIDDRARRLTTDIAGYGHLEDTIDNQAGGIRGANTVGIGIVRTARRDNVQLTARAVQGLRAGADDVIRTVGGWFAEVGVGGCPEELVGNLLRRAVIIHRTDSWYSVNDEQATDAHGRRETSNRLCGKLTTSNTSLAPPIIIAGSFLLLDDLRIGFDSQLSSAMLLRLFLAPSSVGHVKFRFGPFHIGIEMRIGSQYRFIVHLVDDPLDAILVVSVHFADRFGLVGLSVVGHVGFDLVQRAFYRTVDLLFFVFLILEWESS